MTARKKPRATTKSALGGEAIPIVSAMRSRRAGQAARMSKVPPVASQSTE